MYPRVVTAKRNLLFRRRCRATTSTLLTEHHVPDLTSFTMILGVETSPLMFLAVVRASSVRGLVFTAFVAAVMRATSHERHLAQIGRVVWCMF